MGRYRGDGGLWALVASTIDVDAGVRSELGRRMELWSRSNTGHAVVLSTCHRVELYGVGPQPELGALRPLAGDDAVRHLLRVAAGLESVIVGEDEVLHQVREAYRRAQAVQPLDRRLHRLFETAVACGRKARSRRTESGGNLAHAAIAWLRERTELGRGLVVVGGAGRMGAALAHAASSTRARVVVASRDATRAGRLAALYGGAGVDLRAGAELVTEARAVAVAMGGPWNELESVALDDPPPIADISAPQAVPDAVRARLDGAFLGIDDLGRRPGPVPRAFVEEAEGIVRTKVAEYGAWVRRAA